MRAWTARLLIPWSAITARTGSQLDAWHLAQELGFTERLLSDRLQYASSEELQVLPGAGS